MIKNVIIDTDMAFGSPNADVDDALALLVAFGMHLDIKAITATGGNVSGDKASRNIDNLVKRLKLDHIPHSYTAGNTIDPYNWIQARWQSSSEEFVPYENYKSLPHSVELLKKTIDEAKEDSVTLVTIGPMTNIALLLKQYPTIKKSIKAIYSMGGSVSMPGVANGNAEFNIKTDPEAAEIVFSSGIPIYLFPLDVTKKKKIDANTISAWNLKKGLIKELHDASIAFMTHRAKRDGYYPDEYAFYHDVMPIVALKRPDFFKFKKCSISVELNDCINRGVTLVNKYSGNCYIALDVNAESLFSFVQDIVLSSFRGVL